MSAGSDHSPGAGQGHHGHGHRHHHHGHAHAHGHVTPGSGNARAFAIGIALNGAFVLVEAGVGLYANSVAVLADAGHNLSDVLALALAWGAQALARLPPSARYTYGLRSSTIWAALANAGILLLAVGSIAWEALGRFGAPPAVQPGWIIAIALAGVAVNGATAALFHSAKDGDLNARGAYLHMVADAAVSLGVALAGAAIIATGWLWLDPAVSLLVSVFIIYASWGLLRESLDLSLHSVPGAIRVAAVKDCLERLDGVASVHDLHVWAMSTTETALTAHLVIPEGHPGDDFLAHAAHELEHRFGICHATLQIERGDTGHPCKLAPDEVV
jgi:cobalt-zinc-cadmium efflux system protein